MKKISSLYRIPISLASFLLLVAMYLLSSLSYGQELARFSFEGSDGDDVNFPVDAQPNNATVSKMSRGNSITANALENGFNADFWPVAVDPAPSVLDADSYYEFTIAPKAGYTLSFTKIAFNHRYADDDGSMTADDNFNWSMRSSRNNFNADIGSSTVTLAEVTKITGAWNGAEIALTGADFQNLTAPITFKLYAYGLASTTMQWGIDNVIIYATVEDKTPPVASAPTSTDQTLRGGVTSTSTVQSNEAGKIYLYLSTVTTPTTQAEINALVTDNKAFLGKDNASANTAYTVTPTASLADGLYNIIAIDNAGYVSASVAGWLTVDNTAPSVPGTPDLAASSDSHIDNDDITNDVTPTFTGTGTTGETITLYTDNPAGTIGSSVVSGGGNWSITASTLGTGVHKITATAKDVVGNESSKSTALDVKIDTSAPTATSIKRKSPTTRSTNADEVTFEVIFSEDVIQVDIADFYTEVGGAPSGNIASVSPVGSSKTTYDVKVNNLTGSGVLELKFKALKSIFDIALNRFDGNVGTKEDYLIDKTPPTVTSIAVDTNPIFTGDLTQQVTVIYDEEMDATPTPNIKINGSTKFTKGAGAWSNGNKTYKVTFAHDINTPEEVASATAEVIAVGGAKDLVGNLATLNKKSIPFVIDTKKPSPTNTPTATAGPYINKTEEIAGFPVVVNLGTSGAKVGNELTLLLDGQNFPVAITKTLTSGDISSKNVIFTIVYGQLGADGIKKITAQLTDNAGNKSDESSALTLTLDTTLPTAVISNTGGLGTDAVIRNGETVIITATFNESVTTPKITIGTIVTEINMTQGANDKIWTYRWIVPAGNHPNPYNVSLKGEDKAGNPITNITGNTRYTIDNVQPTITKIERTQPNPHNAGIDAGSVKFKVTFSEPVTNIRITDFSYTQQNLKGNPTIAQISNTTGSSTELTINNFDLLDDKPSGTLDLNLNQNNNITDVAGNKVKFTTLSAANNQKYTIINPAPTQGITNLSTSRQTTTEIDISWTISTQHQIAYQHLVLVAIEGAIMPNLQNGTFIANDFSLATGKKGIIAINIGHNISKAVISRLNSGKKYKIKVYPYTNDGTNIKYGTGTNEISVRTKTAAESTLKAGTVNSVDFPSNIDNKNNAFTVFDFIIKDDGLNPQADDAPTVINKIEINLNKFERVTPWTEMFAGVKLVAGNESAIGNIDSDKITFNLRNKNIGKIADNGSKKYELRLWLKTNLSPELKEKIDNGIIIFTFYNTNFDLDTSSSRFKANNVAVQSSNHIRVTATKFAYNDRGNPIYPIQGGREQIDLTDKTKPAPVFEAVDKNGNLDRDYKPGNITKLSIKTPNNEVGFTLPRLFVNGRLPLDKLFYAKPRSNNSNNGTLTISAPGVVAGSTPPISIVDTEAKEIIQGIAEANREDVNGKIFLSGAINRVLLGFELNTITATANKPDFKSLTVRFKSADNPPKPIDLATIYEKFRIFRSKDAKYDASDEEIKNLTVNAQKDHIIITGLSEQLDGNPDNQRYFIVANISLDADKNNGSVVAYINPKEILISDRVHDIVTGSVMEGEAYTFKDVTAPDILSTDPVNREETAPTNTKFTITFTETVKLLNPTNALILKKVTDSNFSEPLVLESPANNSKESKTFVFKRATNTLLEADIYYYITIVEGDKGKGKGFIDGVDNVFKGIKDNSKWVFKTKDQTPPKIETLTANDLNSTTLKVDVKMNERGKVRYIVMDKNTIPVPTTSKNIDDLINQGTQVVFSGVVEILDPNQLHTSIGRGFTPNSGPYLVYAYGIDRSDNISQNPEVKKSNEFSFNSLPSSGVSTVGPTDQILCVGSFQPMSSPIMFIENNSSGFSSNSEQTITLGFTGKNPLDFEFDITKNPTSSKYQLQYTSNNVLRITFTPTTSVDVLKLQDLAIKSSKSDAEANLEIIGASSGAGVSNGKIVATFKSSVGNATVDFNFFEESIVDNKTKFTPLVNNSVGTQVRRVLIKEASTVVLGANTRTFTGPAVSIDKNANNNFYFYPLAAGEGVHNVIMKYTDTNNCVTEKAKEISVFDSKNAIDGVNENYCIARKKNGEFVPQNVSISSGSKTGFTLETLSLSVDNIATDAKANIDSEVLKKTNNSWTFKPHLATKGKFKNNQNQQVDGTVSLEMIGTYVNKSTNVKRTFIQTVHISSTPTIERFIPSRSNSSKNRLDHCEDDDEIELKATLRNPKIHGSREEKIDMVEKTDINIVKGNKGTLEDNGDGSATTEPQDLKNNFKNINTHIYKYTVTNNKTRCTNSDTLKIIIQTKPVADFTTEINGVDSKLKGCKKDDAFEEATTIKFIPDNTGKIDKHSWTFDDPENNESKKPSPTHQYKNIGVYNVGYTVTSDKGCQSDKKVHPINIGNNPIPTINFSQIGIDRPTNFQNVTEGLDETNANDNIAEVKWQFEGGGPVTKLSGARVYDVQSHQYNEAGKYQISMEVTTASGCKRTLWQDIFVVPVKTVSLNNLYKEDFEGTNTNDWIPQSKKNNRTSSWRIASSGGKGVIKGSSKFWVTGNKSDGYGKETSYLYSPIFDFSALKRPLISLSYFSHLKAGADGVYLEYQTYDGTETSWKDEEWEPLGGLGTGIHWFDTEDIASFNQENFQINDKDVGWSKTNDNWMSARHSLSEIPSGGRDRVQFRLSFISGTNKSELDGFGFDNLEIGERTRTVLLENFTNSTQTFDVLEESNYLNKTFLSGNNSGVDVIKLSYHTDFPKEDAYNKENPQDHGARVAYYNIAKVPRAVLDGDNSQTGLFSNWGQKAFEQRSLIMAEFKMNISTTIENKQLKIKIDVEGDSKTPRLNKNDLILNIALVEREMNVSGLPSGETKLYNIVRDLIPNAAGTLIANAEAKAPFTKEYFWTPTNRFTIDSLSVVAFLQDEITKTVYQAEIKSLKNLGLQAITSVEKNINNQLSLYPNPAKDRANIVFAQPLPSEHTLKVYDRFGKLLDKQSLPAGSKLHVINTDQLINGFYFIQIESKNDVLVRKKLVIMK